MSGLSQSELLIRQRRKSWYARLVKPAFDITVAWSILVATAPCHALIALAIMLNDGPPVYFRQQRVGRDGRMFSIIKFRTMKHGTHEKSRGYPTASDLTRLGGVLRRTSVDELPQLFNIIRREMSFIGPRPTLPSQAERYTARQRLRLLGMPGVTGRAQVEYRNQAPWSLRIEADIRYLESLNWRTDLQLVLDTITVALTGRGQEIGQSIDSVDDLGRAAHG